MYIYLPLQEGFVINTKTVILQVFIKKGTYSFKRGARIFT